MRQFLSQISHRLLPYVLIIAFSIVYSWPLLRHPISTITDTYDGMFITWSINWSAYALLHQPLQFYNAPIFHPYQLATTFSDPMLSSGILVAPILALIHEPLLANTVNVFLAFLLTGVFGYFFLFLTTKRRVSSLAGALLLSFGIIHVKYLGQLHTFVIQWILLGLFAWVKFIQTKKIRWLSVVGVAFLLQAVNSPFSAYLFAGCFVPFFFQKESYVCFHAYWKIIVAYGVGVISLVGLFYAPFFYSSWLYHGERSIRDAAHFALSMNEVVGARGIPLFFALILVGFVYVFHKQKQTSSNRIVWVYVVTTISTLILTLGPALKWNGSTVKLPFPIPLPYTVAYFILPGFHAFRSPDRWLVATHILGIIALVLMVTKKREKLFFALTIALLLLEHSFDYPTFTVPAWNNRAMVYKELETTHATNILFLPPKLYSFHPNGAQDEAWNMFYTLPWDSGRVLHLYNGYSGFAPQPRIDGIVQLAVTFPSDQAVVEIEQAEIDTIVVDRVFFQPSFAILFATHEYIKIYEDDSSIVYQKPAGL